MIFIDIINAIIYNKIMIVCPFFTVIYNIYQLIISLLFILMKGLYYEQRK